MSGGWISVKDEKPLNRSPFLGTDGEVIFIAYWVACVGDFDYDKVVVVECDLYYGGYNSASFEGERIAMKKVTHWMELPELPRD